MAENNSVNAERIKIFLIKKILLVNRFNEALRRTNVVLCLLLFYPVEVSTANTEAERLL